MKKIKLTYIYIVAFVIVAYILLPIMNAPYLYALQEHSLFVTGHTFMEETVKHHGGWLVWISCYLTQFFYYPWLGSSIIIAMWVATYFVCIKGFMLNDKWAWTAILPLTFRLYDLLSLGYWLYYAKEPGYAFESTVTMLLVACLGSILVYPLRRFAKNQIVSMVIATIIPFLLPSWRHYDNFGTTMLDTNFRKELKMYRAINECQWEKALAEAPLCKDEKTKDPTNLMVIMKNIALMNTDQTLDKMYEYNNCGVLPTKTADSLNVSMSRQAGPLVYLRYGMVNYAYRWAMENSVRGYQNVDNLKIMIRCAVLNQEWEVAMKYITILKGTTFHKSWAKTWEIYVHDGQLFSLDEEFRTVYPLMMNHNDLDTDEGNVQRYLLEHFTNMDTRNPRLEELALTFSLQAQACNEFMINFYYFFMNHKDIQMPRILDEAAYMFSQLDECPIDMTGYNFDQITIADKYNRFAEEYQSHLHKGLETKEIGEKMRKQYGNTYWWYYYFYTEFNLY